MSTLLKKTGLLTLALTAICAGGGMTAPSAYAQSFTDVQKEELNTMFKDYIMNNPEVLMESVEKYRNDLEQKSRQTSEENLKKYTDYFARKDLPMAGNPDGDITVVEFFDFNCGYCKRAFADIKKLVQDDPNVRVVFQEKPILSPSSQRMALLVVAAHKQGKYFEMHAALMEHQGPQSEEVFLELAKKIGLDTDKLKADAESPEVAKEVEENARIADEIGIRGTPGFVIDGKLYPGYLGPDGLTKVVAEARKNKPQ